MKEESQIDRDFRTQIQNCLYDITKLESEKSEIATKYAGKTYLAAISTDINAKITQCKQKLADYVTAYNTRYTITAKTLSTTDLENAGILEKE